MGIRDDEIERMKKYCAGLNIQLRFVNKPNRAHFSGVATWSPNPSEIIIYTKKHSSKTAIIMSLLHEIGHNCYYSLNNKPGIPDAYSAESERTRSSPPLLKSQRKQIYDYERLSIVYMLPIALELGLKIARWKIEAQMELDTWVYAYYYEHGCFPNQIEYRDMKNEIKRKHKGSVK